jgi:hypothetical protein
MPGRILKRAPDWRVTYRATGARTLPGTRLASDSFRLLPDDEILFDADPFVIQHDGRHHVFVEELPYETGHGVISHFVIDKDGTSSQPRIFP